MTLTLATRLRREESGVAATECALIASLVAVVAAGAIASLGDEVERHYDGVETAVRAASPVAGDAR